MQPRTKAVALSRPGPATSKTMSRNRSISIRGRRPRRVTPPACARMRCNCGELWVLRVPWARRAEQDAARLHSNSGIETQYLFCMVNSDEFCQIHQSYGLTHVARFDARVWAHACLCVGPARCETGRLDGDATAANSRCEMRGACVTADR